MSYSFNDKPMFELIKQGDYEVILSAEKTLSKDKTSSYLNCFVTICDEDAEGNPQEFKGRNVYAKIFKDKENPTMFDLDTLQKIMLTQVGKEGARFTFASDDDLIQYLNGLRLRIKVYENDVDEYHENRWNSINLKFAKKSLAKPRTLDDEEENDKKLVETSKKVVIDDEDIPF